MGAYKALPRQFANIHRKYLTPTTATIWMGAVSIAFYVGLTLVSQNVLGAFVIASFQYAQADYGSTTPWGIGGVFIIGIGTLLFGVVLMFIWNAVAPAFFRGETLPKRSSSDLVLVVQAMEDDHLSLPDSGLPDIIIAPDLSNLPEGGVGLDLESGEEIHNAEELRRLREHQGE